MDASFANVVNRTKNDGTPDGSPELKRAVANEVYLIAIRKGRDQLLRLAASIRSGRFSATVALQRFGSAAQGIRYTGQRTTLETHQSMLGRATPHLIVALSCQVAYGGTHRNCQHSMMLTARPPRDVSLYFVFISAPVCIIVLITESRET